MKTVLMRGNASEIKVGDLYMIDGRAGTLDRVAKITRDSVRGPSESAGVTFWHGDSGYSPSRFDLFTIIRKVRT